MNSDVPKVMCTHVQPDLIKSVVNAESGGVAPLVKALANELESRGPMATNGNGTQGQGDFEEKFAAAEQALLNLSKGGASGVMALHHQWVRLLPPSLPPTNGRNSTRLHRFLFLPLLL